RQSARLVEEDAVDAADAPARGAAASRRRASLVTGAGMVLHRTERPVHSLRTVHVPGSSLELYTWEEEQEDGSRQSFHAYSRGGVVPVGRVRPTSYQVRLRGAQFDPLRERGPEVRGELAAGPDNHLQLVQFLGTPMPEFREAIEGLGGKVLRFLSDHTYLVEMGPSTRAQVAKLPYVRWMGAYHPELRLERELRDGLTGAGARLPRQRYSIMLGERGAERQNQLAGLVRSLGGAVDLVEPGGLRIEATLTEQQLLRVAHANEVQFIDRWGGPGETDMNNVREVSGATYLEDLLGWTGQGVRGEIFDTELLTTHQEWSRAPLIHSTGTSGSSYHGTSCYSNNFAQGVDADARGIIPDGQGIFFRYSESTQFGGTRSRYTINSELTDPAGPYRAVFQTSSVGSARVLDYTTLSAEVDDYLFLHPILSTQSQSNAGSRYSRPQAWAKNIVSVGAMYHYGDANRGNDHWGSGASIGPATDGRVKPDLSFYYDGIRSATGTGAANYTSFGGTSSATPQTAGLFGLLFQMWHEGVWAGHGGKADVFESRPQMATAKALMINNAHRYDWTLGGDNGDLDRAKQGWGTADIRRLLERAPMTSVIDETDAVTPGSYRYYYVDVPAGQTELNVTMAYTDPMGTVGAAQTRINDLSLKVVSPSGTIYWGNNGLNTGNWSVAGGTSNTVDTVENVFLKNPAAGLWRVEVWGDEIVQDARLETTAVDADFGLVVSGGLIRKYNSEAKLPSFSSTFSTASLTRGYWFTAPTDFVITGLQVPNEAGHALQNLEVVRFNAGVAPPAYSGTTNAFTSLFRAVGVSSSSVISTRIPVYAGDVIGILGATGDATVMNSSYGSGSFTSSIFGQPMTLQRLGMQYNLASSAAKELWTESGGSIGRVRMLYGPLNQTPLSTYTNTFSSASLTRGYWFTAPTSFIITGLQVPNEAGHALQNVQVVRFNAGVTPPAYASTTNSFTSLYRAVGKPSDEVLRTFISVSAGDVIGILGATGDSTIMHNSYGAGPFTSLIRNQQVTLQRMGMQYNLASTPAKELWSASGSIGRVTLFYSNP
ncbi:MAG TPA: S8 family serine peptidase, partial [Myxococcaceae bacterium]|nr:S8 family serine peptidase [Myxococcaceae bacterium]